MRALAQRYAAALADVAIESGTARQVKNELASFVGLLAESADLKNFLSSPAVSRATKQAVIEIRRRLRRCCYPGSASPKPR